jgi:uncharacterized repeat protein (TIGR01451 family)
MERICPSMLDSDDNWATNDGVTVNGRDEHNDPIKGTPKAPNSVIGCNEVVFHIPTLAARTYSQAHLVVRVDDPLPARAASVINHAEMTAPSLPAPIHREDVDHIGTLPDLTAEADHTPSLFSPGKLMTYTVTYGNAGRMHAEGVVITATLPISTTYVGYGWESADGQTYTHTLSSLPAGDTGPTLLFVVEYTLSEPQQIATCEFTSTPFTIASADANTTTYAYIGVPDLVVTDFSVTPFPLEPDVPVTFTVVLENQGTGMAWNADMPGAGFFVDIYSGPIPPVSYPTGDYGEIYASPDPIPPGAQCTLVVARINPYTTTRISFQDIEGIEAFYVKVDSYEYAGHPYGLVPECDEMNNLGPRLILRPYPTYLPLIQR